MTKSRLRLDRGNIRTWLVVVGCLVAVPQAAPLVLCWALILPGAALHLWAKGCLRQNQEVTCAGPYRWTRNPFYLGNFLIDLGIAIAINQPLVLLVFLPLWFLVYHREILQEERNLEQLFGDSYRHYKARVPRFWPLRRPANDLPPDTGFSWSNPNLAWGSEYGRLTRVLYTPLLIWMCREVAMHRWAILTGHHSLMATGLALLGVLVVLERAVVKRFRRGRRLVPPAAQHWAVHAALLTGFAVLAFGTEILETEGPYLPIAGLAVLVAVFLALSLAGSSRLSPPLIRWTEGLACLAGGIMGEMPWLGVFGFGCFGVLAIDSVRTLSFLEVEEPPPTRAGLSLPLQRALVLGTIAIFAALGVAKEIVLDPGSAVPFPAQ